MGLSQVLAFTSEHGVDVDCAISGLDGRRGTALSVALERHVAPVEMAISPEARLCVVQALLAERADPTRPGPYCAWWGVAPADSLVSFAIANGCTDRELLTLLATGGWEVEEERIR